VRTGGCTCHCAVETGHLVSRATRHPLRQNPSTPGFSTLLARPSFLRAALPRHASLPRRAAASLCASPLDNPRICVYSSRAHRASGRSRYAARPARPRAALCPLTGGAPTQVAVRGLTMIIIIIIIEIKSSNTNEEIKENLSYMSLTHLPEVVQIDIDREQNSLHSTGYSRKLRVV